MYKKNNEIFYSNYGSQPEVILLIPPPLARVHCLELFFVVMTGEILLDCRSWDAAKHATIHKTQLLRNYQPHI